MEYMIAFSTPAQGTGERYDRYDSDKTWVWKASSRTMVARLYIGYDGSGMVPAKLTMTKAVQLKIVSKESGVDVDVLLGPDSAHLVNQPIPKGVWSPVPPDGWTLDGYDAIQCCWTIKKGMLPKGIYYVTSTADTTLQFPLIINDEGIAGPPVVAKKLFAQPVYMNIGTLKGWPRVRNTAIIDNPGIRVGSTAPKVPFLDGGLFTAPFVHTVNKSEMYSEALAVSLEGYHGYQWPTETPAGGPFFSAVQRYNHTDSARPNPTLDAKNAALTCSAPNELSAGDSQTSSLGVCPSAYQLANKDIIVLSSNGRIVRVNFNTREHTTLYGWEKIPGTAQTRAGFQIPPGEARLSWYKKYFRFVGVGPDIGRAWQMRPAIYDDMYVWVADPTNHVIHGIDLRTGVSTVVAGTFGVAGHADGVVGVGKLNQPRGVIQIKSGQYAGELVVASEHGSAFMLVDLVTGQMTTLAKAARVPTNLPSDFTQSISVNRARWGATAKQQSLDDPLIQFCHPCQMDLFSDGKTILTAHHDELQLFKLDLDSRTLTIFYSAPTETSNGVALVNNWPTVNVDRSGALGIKDGVYVAHWHANSQVVLRPDGTKHPFYTSSQASPGDGPGIENDAYPRLLAPLPDGSLIVHGDGHTHIHRVRKIRPDDPKIKDVVRFDRGRDLYQSDGPNRRCSVMVINGAQGRNMLAGYLTPGELAMLEPAARKAYMIEKFNVVDWTDQDHLDVAYYLDMCDPVGVALMRGNIKRPAPVVRFGFDEAVSIARTGMAMVGAGGTVTLTKEVIAAQDWVAV